MPGFVFTPRKRKGRNEAAEGCVHREMRTLNNPDRPSPRLGSTLPGRVNDRLNLCKRTWLSITPLCRGRITAFVLLACDHAIVVCIDPLEQLTTRNLVPRQLAILVLITFGKHAIERQLARIPASSPTIRSISSRPCFPVRYSPKSTPSVMPALTPLSIPAQRTLAPSLAQPAS